MEMYRGMRMLTFVSFTFGVSAVVVCGWTFWTNRVYDFNHPANENSTQNPCNSTYSGPQTEPGKVQASDVFRKTIMRSSVVVILVCIVQIVSAAVVLGSKLQGCRRRSQVWFGLNLGVNLILLICLIVPLMYAEENRQNLRFSELVHSATQCADGGVLHLSAFYIAVCLDFVVQFLALILCLMILRFDENRDYELVAML